jgi:hypothetical protein
MKQQPRRLIQFQVMSTCQFRSWLEFHGWKSSALS